ncbi:MAG TPA: sulfotransferase domain-containing protein [Rhizomicrobium sp.]|jgi:aryl sulfotransferase|nr:sulfotransferase domain-containing protein [Rhizomicrobium sp.]
MLAASPTREIRSWTTDSRRWAHYLPRAGDIVIATAPKCGTTWMQQIASLLVFQSPEPREIQLISPWIDFRLPPIEAVVAAIEAQTHRRFLKSHLPFDAMPIYDEARYIHVARDGRDAFMSWHNHASHYSPMARQMQSAAGEADETIARPLPQAHPDPRAHFAAWMTEGGGERLLDDAPASLYFQMEKSWWAQRHRANVLLVHYNDLKADIEGEMRRIAAFLDIAVDEALWPKLARAAGFEFMREHGATLMPRAALSWDKGHERFINEGRNDRWREALSAEDVAAYEARAAREFSPALKSWLEKGRLIAGDPRSSRD